MGAKGLEYQEQLFSTYGPTTIIKGFLGTDLVCTIDPAIIHAVQIKDKDKFPRAQGPAIMLRAVFGGGLLALPPDEHRVQRKLLNPVFNMKHLRECGSIRARLDPYFNYNVPQMPIFMSIAKETTTAINKDLAAYKGSKEVDVFPWATAAALDLVGEAGLGYAFNSFSGERNEYSTAIKGVTQSFGKIGPFVQLLPYVHRLGTPAFRQWVMDLIPSNTLQHLRRVVRLQNGQAEEVLRAREASLSAGNDLSSQAGRGRDIVTLLMKANESAGSESFIDRETMIGHMNVFILAGHETTSTAVSRILDVLAHHPDVQVRLREELRQYFQANPDETHHDALLELSYLDRIVREVLRLYPPVAVISRM
ncbi:cytochrome P450-dit2 [Ceratobasidium sp. 423]|nr:cytochrome P450-dit2 [Ceratobasidium sp. 423]